MNRLAAVATAVIVTTTAGVACSSAPGGAAASPSSTASSDQLQGTPGPVAGGGGTGAGSSPRTPGGSVGPGETPSNAGDRSTTTRGSGSPTSTTRATQLAHPLAVDDRGTVGSMGPALLRPEVPRVVIEVDATPGSSLSDQARSALRRRVVENGNKQSVDFVAGSTIPAQDTYSPDDLRRIMTGHRSDWSSSRQAGLYVEVLSGTFQDPSTPGDDGDTVGLSFDASAFAVFVDHVPSGTLGLTRADYEEAVVVHELGHLYGLVDLTGHGAFHEDPDHPGHSANKGSVMYWAIEYEGPVQDLFQGGPPKTFDADDRREMELIRAAA